MRSIVVQKTDDSGNPASLYTGRVLVGRRCVVVALRLTYVVGGDGAYAHDVFG